MKLAALIKKELFRFFRDPRLIVTMILPGILIYIIYSIMGSVLFDDKKEYDFTVYVEGSSQIVDVVAGSVAAVDGLTLTLKTPQSREKAFEEIREKKATAYIYFSDNFDEEVKNYTPDPDIGTVAPQIEIYYNSSDEAGLAFFSLATDVINGYESLLANKFDVNAGSDKYDLSEAGSPELSTMNGIIPFIVVVFIFSSAMSITLESVAGEKERGTLATVLVTSVRRSHVALGKVVPLSCIAMIGAVSSFLGVALSMPKLMGVSVGGFVGGFGFLSYFMLFLLIFSLVPLIVSAICFVSTFSKSVKEASAYTGVIMIVFMVLSLLSVFLGGIGDWFVAIPLLNAVSAMNGILTSALSVWKCLTAVGVNIAVTALIVFGMAKMLSSEKIMFGK